MERVVTPGTLTKKSGNKGGMVAGRSICREKVWSKKKKKDIGEWTSLTEEECLV